MDSTTAISYANKMGLGQILNFDQNSQDLMGILSWKEGQSDWEHLPNLLNQTADWESRK